ncbi:SAM-dependent methyltransferase [Actinoplanes sp. NPDC020271]|uniref:SAM-dependent methyltransferase n=1 Tax=Actinoplanes sp. NPDC020271 TaxID=3363896 RepID=UPI0037955179
MGDHLDTSTVHPARRYNYWLGGKDHFAADRESGDQIEKAHPTIRLTARENRAFLQRAVHHLAADAGIDQFLDIGTGLPTADNTHEVAQRADPAARVVYVDNDPMVMTHARALLAGTDAGRTCYIEADLREPATILNHPQLRDTLDLSRPVGLTLVAVLHFIPGTGQARDIVAALLDALAPGSYLTLTHGTIDFASEQEKAYAREVIGKGLADVFPRTRDEIASFFGDLDLVEPGIVPVSEWRPQGTGPLPTAHDVAIYGGVGRR